MTTASFQMVVTRPLSPAMRAWLAHVVERDRAVLAFAACVVDASCPTHATARVRARLRSTLAGFALLDDFAFVEPRRRSL